MRRRHCLRWSPVLERGLSRLPCVHGCIEIKLLGIKIHGQAPETRETSLSEEWRMSERERNFGPIAGTRPCSQSGMLW